MVWWSPYDKKNVRDDRKMVWNDSDKHKRSYLNQLQDEKLMMDLGNKMRLSPLMITLTPNTIKMVDIRNLIEAGMNIIRINCMVLNRNDLIKALETIEEAVVSCCKKHGVDSWPVARAIDMPSCGVHTGILKNTPETSHISICADTIDKVLIREGTDIILTNDSSKYNQCNSELIFVDYSHLTVDVRIGMEIVIACEEIVVKCEEIVNDESIRCSVKKSGELGHLETVIFRGATYSSPHLAKRDLEIINFAIEKQLDIIIVPCTRTSKVIKKVKNMINEKKTIMKVIAGINNMQGYANLEEILEESDGIILGRHFITYNQVVDRTAMLQKNIAALCKKRSKPMFISGNLMEDMLLKNSLTCVDMSDLTNCLMDGAGGFVIRSYIGVEIKTILKAMITMSKICTSVESIHDDIEPFWRLAEEVHPLPLNAAETCAMSSTIFSRICESAAIFVTSTSGLTAQFISALRPACIIVALTTNARVARLLNLYRNVIPLVYSARPAEKFQQEVQNRINYMINFSLEKGLASKNDNIIVVSRSSSNAAYCDTVQMREICHKKLTCNF